MAARRSERADDLVCLGVVTGPRGLKGEVRIRSFTADPADLARYGTLCDETGGRSFRVRVTGGTKGQLVARIEGVEDRDAAEALKGVRLHVRRAALPAVETESDVYSDEIVSIDHRAHLVTVRGRPVELTGYEYRLLSVFVGHPGQVLNQEHLLDLVWGANAIEASIDSVRLYVGYLRRKIEVDPRKPVLIETVRGFGYRYLVPRKIG